MFDLQEKIHGAVERTAKLREQLAKDAAREYFTTLASGGAGSDASEIAETRTYAALKKRLVSSEWLCAISQTNQTNLIN